VTVSKSAILLLSFGVLITHAARVEKIINRDWTFQYSPAQNGQPVSNSVTMAGAPARIILKTSSVNIPADRSGIAIISADIVDANGVHVYGASPPLTWKVEGPATLVGPPVYKTDTNKKPPVDQVAGIIEPALVEQGRLAVIRDRNVPQIVFAAKLVADDFNFLVKQFNEAKKKKK
jgi:hypothetical protein